MVEFCLKATPPLFFSGAWEAFSQRLCAGAAVAGTLAQETRSLIQVLLLTSCVTTGEWLALSVCRFPSSAVGAVLGAPLEGCQDTHLSGWMEGPGTGPGAL